MTDTTTPTAPAPATPPASQPRDFAAAMHARFVAKDGLTAEKRKVLLIPVLLLAISAGLGTAARALPPTWATVVTGTLAVLIGLWGVLAVWAVNCLDPLQGVDWGTADDYEEKVTSGLGQDVRAVLTQAQAQVRRQFPAADRVHLYVPDRLPEHPCTLDTTGCRCAGQRINAAILPHRSHPIIKVGDRLLDDDNSAVLEYVLAHEINHVRRGWKQLRYLQQMVNLSGWLWVGLLVPLPALLVVAPALWVAIITFIWVDEFAADIAARTTGPDGARGYWAMCRAGYPTRTGMARVGGAVLAVLAPLHPPVALRAALADRIAHRP